MINQTLIWFLLLPIILGVVLWFFHREIKNAWFAPLMFGIASIIVITLTFLISSSAATSDVEIWNGQVVSKAREHGSYQRPYECNCTYRESCTGSGSTRSCTQVKSCSTCYEDRYTVTWSCNTTVGNVRIDHEDWGSRKVYGLPDSAFFTGIKKGDPASKTSTYTNYVQAVPNSLFTPSAESLKAKFAPLIPAYPDQIFNYYNINRVLTPGWKLADIADWNADVGMALRDLGPQKQVNLIIVIAKTSDPNYEYALRDAWEGANKNDVVVVIGSTEYPKIEWVRVISWTKNELFKVELRDRIQDLGTINRSIVTIASSQIAKNFQRRKMSEFKYLESEIDPPTWLLVSLLTLLIAGAGGTWYAMHNASDLKKRMYKFRRM